MINYEQDLYRVAYMEVVKESYPDPIADKTDEIKTKRKEIKLFHSGRLPGIPLDPALKKEMHDRLTSELEDLIVLNSQIINTNKNNKLVVDIKYKEDINDYVTDPVNISRAAWGAVRVERNQLLKESDFVNAVDTKLKTALKSAWKDYRQSLRDIPQNNTDPFNIVWPERPAYEKG